MGPMGSPHFKRPKLVHGILSIEGTVAADKLALRLKAGDAQTLQVDVGDNGSADFSFDRKKIAKIDVRTGNGDDSVRIDESNGVFTDSIPTTIDGGPGNDTIAGGSGNELLIGGDGNDVIDGNKGSDTALLGAGDDVFVWDPGDGSDIVEGGDGSDTMRFNGAAAAEQFTLSANGNRLRFFRDVGNIAMDTAGVERVDVNALGGADLVTVNDLSGTDVSSVNVDLAGSLGGTAGDGAVDRVVVNGTAGDDAIKLAGDASGVSVSGLRSQVSIQHQEPTDQLEVHGLAGNDSIDASALAAGAIGLTQDGGAGDDTLAGSQGVETLIGGDGNDVIDGNKGNDTASMGDGDDVFVWDPGDGSDVVDGGDGRADTMRFNGAAAAEQFTLSPNGNRLRFFRDVGNITMDTVGVELVDVHALGGADLVTVDDLSGTDVSRVNVDLAGSLGGTAGDGAVDRVVMNGTAGADAINVVGDSSVVKVAGLTPLVSISNPEATDRLELNDLQDNDTVNTADLAAGAIQVFLDGGLLP
jgi:Ca2+-binding RTX toxin-like protein